MVGKKKDPRFLSKSTKEQVPKNLKSKSKDHNSQCKKNAAEIFQLSIEITGGAAVSNAGSCKTVD